MKDRSKSGWEVKRKNRKEEGKQTHIDRRGSGEEVVIIKKEIELANEVGAGEGEGEGCERLL